MHIQIHLKYNQTTISFSLRMPHEISPSVCDPVAPATLDTLDAMFFMIYYAIIELLHHN